MGAFGVCVIGGVGIVLGLWTPKDDEIKKRLLTVLFTGVIGSILVGVGVLFARPSPVDAGEASGNSNIGTNEAPVSNRSAGRESPPTPAPAPTPISAPPAPEPAEAGDIPAELRQWAEAALGARPDLSPAFQRDYPACVARLRGRPAADTSIAESHDCAREVRGHRRQYIVTLSAERTRYAEALQSEQTLLIRQRLGDGDLSRLDFLRSENENYFARNGPAYLLFKAADQRSLEDLRLCETQGCGEE